MPPLLKESSSPNSIEGLHPDAWLTQILNKNTYRLDISGKNTAQIESSFKAATSQQQGPLFIFTKVKTAHSIVVAQLQDLGFKLVDTAVTFQKSILNPTSSSNVNVREARPEDQAMVVEIARENLTTSRFHLDSKIPQEIAREIKSRWVENFFNQKRGDELLLAEIENQIAAFSLFLFSGETLIVDLVASRKEFRRRSAARSLLQFSEQKFKQFKFLSATTQISNQTAIQFYENYGFKILKSEYVFHFHR